MSFLTFVCLAFLIGLLVTGILLGQEESTPKRHLMGHNQLGMPIYAPPPSYEHRPSPFSRWRYNKVSEFFGPGVVLAGLASVGFWLSGLWENGWLRKGIFIVAATLAILAFVNLHMAWRTYCVNCRTEGRKPLLGNRPQVLLFMLVMGLAVVGCVWGFWTGDRLWPVPRASVSASDLHPANDLPSEANPAQPATAITMQFGETLTRWQTWYLASARWVQITVPIAALLAVVIALLFFYETARVLLLKL